MGKSDALGGLATISPVDQLSQGLSQLRSLNASTLVTIGATAAIGFAVWEQFKFKISRRTKKGELAGPKTVTPLLGGIVEMVKDPYGFWEKQRQYSFPGMSWNSLVGQFSVFVTDAAISRHVFNNNSADTLLMALHPSGKAVLGERNIAFLHGPDHKALRKSFLALFTRKALGVYVNKQDEIIKRHIDTWLASFGSNPTEMRPFIRDLNAFTSQEVFAGPYLDDQVVRAKFSEAYRNMTDAFLAFPLCVPGTAVWKGRQGRLFIIKVLTEAAGRSKRKMAAGHEPECLLDFWAQAVLAECKEAEEQGVPPPFYAADAKMADSVMDFLFASQDASTASLVWTLTQMAEHPEVLAKVREEQLRLRSNLAAPIPGEVLNDMTYTRQVVKEILRFRPPAPMVPQIAQQPFKLTEDYTAPKGSMIIPSVWGACMQGYENAETFDPDRFGPERKEDVKFAGNFLVFGHGPHYCVGKEYATNHLTCFLARMATDVDWTRLRSKESDKIIYLPTLYPGDSVFSLKRSAVAKKGAKH